MRLLLFFTLHFRDDKSRVKKGLHHESQNHADPLPLLRSAVALWWDSISTFPEKWLPLGIGGYIFFRSSAKQWDNLQLLEVEAIAPIYGPICQTMNTTPER